MVLPVEVIKIIDLIASRRERSLRGLSENVIEPLHTQVFNLHDSYREFFINLREKIAQYDNLTYSDIQGLIEDVDFSQRYGANYREIISGILTLNDSRRKVVLDYIGCVQDYLNAPVNAVEPIDAVGKESSKESSELVGGVLCSLLIVSPGSGFIGSPIVGLAVAKSMPVIIEKSMPVISPVVRLWQRNIRIDDRKVKRLLFELEVMLDVLHKRHKSEVNSYYALRRELKI